ncbi:MAG: hypothetical protein QGF78_06410 [Candidatus Bathyarchaeota archaeon]|jgi:hypothetical protein|nr:hypothetical protein [Candidatus Bathyarchaeota archaeon]
MSRFLEELHVHLSIANCDDLECLDYHHLHGFLEILLVIDIYLEDVIVEAAIAET